MTAKMVSILKMQKTMAFGEEQFTSQLTLHILVEILHGVVMPTNSLMGTSYLMKPLCLLGQRWLYLPEY